MFVSELDIKRKTSNQRPCETKEFDLLELPSFSSIPVFLKRATELDIDEFHGNALARVERLASAKTIKRVASYHPDNIWVVCSAQTGSVLGCYAQIMLSHLGRAALLSGGFDGLRPRQEHCADKDIADIYTWAVIAPGRAALGVTLMSQILRQARYRTLDLYTVPVTEDGWRSIKAISYRPVFEDAPMTLFKYRRLANRANELPVQIS